MIYSIILLFDNLYFYLAIILFLLFYPKKRLVVFWGITGASLDILLNIFLKGYFKIPLASHLHFGYAFPSGHLQLATFIYLWLAFYHLFYIEKIYYLIIPLIATATVESHFHTWTEVYAGIIAGSLFFLFFSHLIKQKKIVIFNIIMLYICVLDILITKNNYIPSIVYIVNIVLFINLLIYLFFSKKYQTK